EAYLQLGSTHQELGETDVAIARYQKVLAFEPKSVPLQTLVGNLYLNKGDLATARKYYEQALAVNPNSPIAAANRAWVLGRPECAVRAASARQRRRALPQLQ